MPQSAERGWLWIGLGFLLIVVNPIPLGLLAYPLWLKARAIFADRWTYAQSHGYDWFWVTFGTEHRSG